MKFGSSGPAYTEKKWTDDLPPHCICISRDQELLTLELLISSGSNQEKEPHPNAEWNVGCQADVM